MNHVTRRLSLCNRQATLFVLAWLIALAAVWPGVGRAQSSAYCPTLSAAVSWGGAATIDVTACDGPFDGGMSGPIAPFAQHGTVAIGPNDLPGQFVTYTHNGLTGSADTFALEDNELGVVTVNITIAPPATVLALAPAALPAMAAGTPFSQTLTTSGGTAPYTYSVVSGALPPGLSLTSGGVLAGTPTQRGIYSFSVQSQDAIGPTVVRAYTGIVQNPDLSVAPASGTAISGVAFSQALTATGGVAPYTIQLESGTLPSGIVISGSGVVSGTTTAPAGNYPVTLRVTDASTGPGTYFELLPYTLTVSAPPSVSISVAPASVTEDGATNLVFTVTRSLNLSSPTVVNLTTTGSATAGDDYAGAVATVTIPAGGTTASFAIDPTPDGAVEPDETVIVAVAAGAGYTAGTPASATGTILNDDAPVSVTPAVLPSGTVATAYAQILGASGGTGPYTFAVTAGALPAGLTLSSTGALGGTPTAGGSFDFTVTATDSSAAPGPYSGSRAYALVVNAPVISLAPSTLANATAGTPYSASVTASGGTSPYAFAVTAGSLPAGVTLSASGALAGTPTATGTFNFTVTATDSSTGTGPFTGTQAYTLTVDAAVVSPTISTVTANPTIVAADGVATSVITVTARDAGGNPLSGRPASLSQGSGASTISPPTVTDGSGAATFTVSDATAETLTYSAVVDGVTLGQSVQVDFLARSATGTTPNGSLTASITGGSCIGFAPGSAQFSVPASTPPGRAFPYGVFGFRALGCGTGGSITLTLTFPNPIPPEARYHKLQNGVWVDWTSRVTIAGNTVVLTIADGADGDTDPAAGVIADPSGLTVAATVGAAAIPTLSEWGIVTLALLMLVAAASVGFSGPGALPRAVRSLRAKR